MISRAGGHTSRRKEEDERKVKKVRIISCVYLPYEIRTKQAEQNLSQPIIAAGFVKEIIGNW